MWDMHGGGKPATKRRCTGRRCSAALQRLQQPRQICPALHAHIAKLLRVLKACAGSAAPRPPPVPAACSDRVAERALRCLLALLRGAYAAPPWDAPPCEPGAAADQGERGSAADGGRRNSPASAPDPPAGVLVDLLQRLAALAEAGRERSAEEVLPDSRSCMCKETDII